MDGGRSVSEQDIRTTGVANCVTTLVSSPQWSNGSSTILTSHDDCGVLRLDAQRSNVDR
jgi:hypothetical protein